MQYARFVRGLVTLDLGESVRRPGSSAVARVLDAAGPTASLAALAVLLGAVLGISAAVLGAGPWLGAAAPLGRSRSRPRSRRRRSSRSRPCSRSRSRRACASFRCPAIPRRALPGLVFASGLLALPLAAHVARVSRAALDDVARAQFLGVARAKGGSYARVLWLHALPASIGPIVTVIGTQLGALLGGAVVLERLFERRGLGTLDPRGLCVARPAGARGRGRLLGRALRRRAAARRGGPRRRSIRGCGDDARVARALGASARPHVAPRPSARARARRRRRRRRERPLADPARARALVGRALVGVAARVRRGRRRSPRARRAREPARRRPRGGRRRSSGSSIGCPLGAAAAVARGRFERAVARACDLVQAFPTFLLALVVLSAVRSPSRVHLGVVFVAHRVGAVRAPRARADARAPRRGVRRGGARARREPRAASSSGTSCRTSSASSRSSSAGPRRPSS